MNRTAPILAMCLASVMSSGCGVLERWACPDADCDGVAPIVGTVEDFTYAGQDDDHATVSTPAPCDTEAGAEPELDEAAFTVEVQTHGSEPQPDPSSWLNDELYPELNARGMFPPQRGAFYCPMSTDDDDGLDTRLVVNDWAELDAIVGAALEVVADDDIALTLRFVIEPEPIPCADVACGR